MLNQLRKPCVVLTHYPAFEICNMSVFGPGALNHAFRSTCPGLSAIVLVIWIFLRILSWYIEHVTVTAFWVNPSCLKRATTRKWRLHSAQYESPSVLRVHAFVKHEICILKTSIFAIFVSPGWHRTATAVCICCWWIRAWSSRVRGWHSVLFKIFRI